MNVLTFNAGSSSLKYGIYDVDAERAQPLISQANAMEPSAAGARTATDAALESILRTNIPFEAIGHRMVFGGPDD
ncbi:MAG: acetate kinase, partial [Candidatus Baltobacteraceae bacterium]